MYFFGNCAQWVSNNTWCITEKVSNLFCLTYNACFSVIGSFQLPNWIFLFVLNYFHYYSSNVHYCKDCFHIHVFIRKFKYMTFTYSQSFMLDCVTNKCEREGREGKNNDSINNLRTREALDCEKREMEKRLEATWPLRNMSLDIWHLYFLKTFIHEGSKTYRSCYKNNFSNNFFSFFWFNLHPRWHPLPWNKQQRVVKTS